MFLFVLQCEKHHDADDSSVPGLAPSRSYEGQGEDICNYHVNFHTKYGCPRRLNMYAKLSPQITAGQLYPVDTVLFEPENLWVF